METTGRHILAEFSGCDPKVLNDSRAVVRALHAAVAAAGATIVGDLVYPFTPQGVSAVVLVAESHFSIHTWPEYSYASADIYTCGNCKPEQGMLELGQWLQAKETHLLRVHRGQGADMRVERLNT
jgi:S-adenosylmethionine decarboxylase proenzyme